MKLLSRRALDQLGTLQASVQELRQALQTIVVLKRQYLDEEFKSLLVMDVLQKNPANPIDKLSKRELTIAKFLVKGKSMDEIATHLSIEPSTIRTYKARIFQKLDVATLHEFLIKAKLYKLE